MGSPLVLCPSHVRYGFHDGSFRLGGTHEPSGLAPGGFHPPYTAMSLLPEYVPRSPRSMPRPVPAWLKRLLVPAWNAAHRWGWTARDYLDVLAHRRFEPCNVCGAFRPMLYRRRVIPSRLEQLWGLSPRLAEALARKESCDCASCGAKLRCRRIAQAVLALYPVGDPPTPAPSLANWVAWPQIHGLRVAEINRIDGLHDVFRRLPAFAASDYRPGAEPGAMVEGVCSEDLTRLTYPDACFDLVLTSETLEHVPDLDAALREIHRVLVPGGYHVFTVPVLPQTERTFPRAMVRPDGSVEDLAPRIAHPGGDWGYPVFTEFGADLPDLLRRAKFEVDVLFGPTREDDLAQVYVCRKPM
jgi:SAM-dependent methyltransferase